MEQALWRRFREARTPESFAQGWLAIQSGMLESADTGVVLLRQRGGEFQPAAQLPEQGEPPAAVLEAARDCLDKRQGLIRGSVLAYPFLVDEQLFGAVALALPGDSQVDPRQQMRKLQWGSAWMELLYRQEYSLTPSSESDRLQQLMGLVASALQDEDFQSCLNRIVTGLATDLRCERASIGFWRGPMVRVQALSHSATYTEKTELVEHIASAMTEAADQNQLIQLPRPQGEVSLAFASAHEQLLQEEGAGAVLSVPLAVEGRVTGCLTLEFAGATVLPPELVSFLQTLANYLGPILELRALEARPLPRKVADSSSQWLAGLLGTEQPWKKLLVSALAVLIVLMLLLDGDYRVTADSQVEGKTQRVVAAAIDGYISEAFARAGDLVEEGQPLYRLDDRQLTLQRIDAAGQREQYLKRYRDARASSDRAELNAIRAQIDQAEARIQLFDEQLSRTRGVAPFRGVVVSGDLSQRLGAPVRQGDVLFEVAPLDDYRIILQIDERDIADLEIGQKGRLMLNSGFEDPLPFEVARITPVAVTRDGKNFFEVEARLLESNQYVRPGLKGVAKVEVGERNLMWIWTHRLGNWLRLTLWRYLP